MNACFSGISARYVVLHWLVLFTYLYQLKFHLTSLSALFRKSAGVDRSLNQRLCKHVEVLVLCLLPAFFCYFNASDSDIYCFNI
jgi:hypothetical protein